MESAPHPEVPGHPLLGGGPGASPGVTRSEALDALRGLAILLVLGSHVHVSDAWSRGGASGVDLFFVLSGFLVSGLLFSELHSTGTIAKGRFLARRALKIYPGFYLLIIVTVALRAAVKMPIPTSELTAELLFVQNYWPGLWGHTWSLAVEEHFYLLLCLGLGWAVRSQRASALPMPRIVFGICVLCLGLRLLTTATADFALRTHVFPTHLRVDTLACGVLLSYWFHVDRERLTTLVRRYRTPGLLTALLCVSLPFCIDQGSWFMTTVGFSLIAYGYSVIVAVAVTHEVSTRRHRVWRPLAAVGRCSYAIYLWHLVVASLGLRIWSLAFHEPSTDGARFAVYATGSVLVGWLMTRLVEVPTLRFRDRWFPPRARLEGVVAPPPPSTA